MPKLTCLGVDFRIALQLFFFTILNAVQWNQTTNIEYKFWRKPIFDTRLLDQSIDALSILSNSMDFRRVKEEWTGMFSLTLQASIKRL